MSRNQFYYKAVKMEGLVKKTEVHHFNMDMVVRGMQWGEGAIIMLADGHEESREVGPAKRDAKGRTQDPKRERQYIVSEIYLDKEDRIRYQKLSSLDEFPTEFPDEKMEAPVDIQVMPADQVPEDMGEEIKEEA